MQAVKVRPRGLSQLSSRTLGTITVIAIVLVLAASWIAPRFVTHKGFEAFLLDRFGVVPPVQVSYSGDDAYRDVVRDSVTGTYDGDVDAHTVRLRRPGGGAVYVAFLSAAQMTELHQHPGRRVVVTAPDLYHASVIYPAP